MVILVLSTDSMNDNIYDLKWPIYFLFSRLSSVILFAQHLAIYCYRFASFVPRRNVISFHFRNIVFFLKTTILHVGEFFEFAYP